MTKSKLFPSKDSVRIWILWGIPILFIIGTIMHFVYEWSGNSVVVGIFAPINESLWEHLKMVFWPMLIWWFIGYCILITTSSTISTVKWFISCAIAELASPIVILFFYFTYTSALGIESLILDVFSLFLGIAVGQGLALHVYKYAKPSRFYLYIAIIILILLAITFTLFTFSPPHTPLFMDSPTGTYGIYMK